MKGLFVAACLFAVLGVMSCEPCTGTDSSTCSRANCDNMYPMGCIDGECHCFSAVCFVGQVLCNDHNAHCDDLAALNPHCNCHHSHSWHCVHGKCHCGGKTN